MASCLSPNSEKKELNEKRVVIIPPADSANYSDAGKGFYRDNSSKLYILTYDADNFDTIYKYYKEVGIVDIASFKFLNYYYAKDDSCVYVFQPDACGTNVFALHEADTKTFEAINYRWGMDKNHVYESAMILDSLNPSHFCLVNIDTSNHFFEYASDGRFMYNRYNLLEKPNNKVLDIIKKHNSDTLFCKYYN